MFKENHPKTLTNTEADAEANTVAHVIHVQCTVGTISIRKIISSHNIHATSHKLNLPKLSIN